MCIIPKDICMKPVLVQKPLDMDTNTMIPVMHCPEYAVRVLLRQMDNGGWKQIWLCDDVPGWFTCWDHLRDRIHTCYTRALSDW